MELRQTSHFRVTVEGSGSSNGTFWRDAAAPEQQQVCFSVSIFVCLSASERTFPLCRTSAYRNLSPEHHGPLYVCVCVCVCWQYIALLVVMATSDHLPHDGVSSEVGVQRVQACCRWWTFLLFSPLVSLLSAPTGVFAEAPRRIRLLKQQHRATRWRSLMLCKSGVSCSWCRCVCHRGNVARQKMNK